MILDPATVDAVRWLFAAVFRVAIPSLCMGIAAYVAVLEAMWLSTGREVFDDLRRMWALVLPAHLALAVLALAAMESAPGPGPFLAIAAAMITATLARSHRGVRFLAALVAAVSAPILACGDAWLCWRAVMAMAPGALLATALAVAGVAAGRLLRDPTEPASGMALRMAVAMAAIAAPLQLADGPASRTALCLSLLLTLFGVCGVALLLRRRLETTRAFLWTALALAGGGALAAVADWSDAGAPGAATSTPLPVWIVAGAALVAGAAVFVRVTSAPERVSRPLEPPVSFTVDGRQALVAGLGAALVAAAVVYGLRALVV